MQNTGAWALLPLGSFLLPGVDPSEVLTSVLTAVSRIALSEIKFGEVRMFTVENNTSCFSNSC